MSQSILVTGATGKQGGGVVNALLNSPNAARYTILAVTRDINSPSAQKLAGKAKNIKLVAGNLDQVPALFDEAVKVAGPDTPIWGVYSVQVSFGKGVTAEGEIRQGNAMIDESVKRGVKHFVYSSVDRGGNEASWDNETPIEHFRTKYHIERHLKDAAGQMGWTVLRPVAFYDNLAPGMQSRVFLTAMRDSLKGKPNQWVAVSDIGWFAAHAFDEPQEFNHKALGLAGDQLTYDEQSAIFAEKVTDPPTPTFAVLGSFLKWAIGDMGVMLNWFGTDGYKVDIQALKKIKPDLKDFQAWLKTDSSFTSK